MVDIDTLDSSWCRDKNGLSRKVNAIMNWETPSFVEINMSAEIGGYQNDFGDRDPHGPAAPRTPDTCSRDDRDAA